MRRFIVGLVLCFATSSAQALCPPDAPLCWEISLFADADCQKCNLSAPLFQWRDFYIKAGTTNSGHLVGAEFRVVGLPADWLHVSTPSEFAGLAVGDPLDLGCNIGFQTPQFGNCIPFYRVSILATSEVQDVELSVVRHAIPSNPNFAECPNVTYSCPPCSKFCALGGSLSINSSDDCTVGVDANSWSAVKSLYSE